MNNTLTHLVVAKYSRAALKFIPAIVYPKVTYVVPTTQCIMKHLIINYALLNVNLQCLQASNSCSTIASHHDLLTQSKHLH